MPQMTEAKTRLQARRCSSTLGDGRCEAREGNGQSKLEMDFLAMSGSPARREGRAFNRERREVPWKSPFTTYWSEVALALEPLRAPPFQSEGRCCRRLHEVGPYIKLGQPRRPSAGGRSPAPHVKRAREICKPNTVSDDFMPDEPDTRAWPLQECANCWKCAQPLSRTGNTRAGDRAAE